MTYSSLIRLPEVLKRTGFSRPWVYKLLKQKRFPPPIKIGGRAIAFVESEVNDWMNSKLHIHGEISNECAGALFGMYSL